MSAVSATSSLTNFQSPAELEAFLSQDKQFKKETVFAKHSLHWDGWSKELEGLSQITELFQSAETHCQGFATNAKVKQLIHAYRIFLSDASEASKQLIAQSVKIHNNFKAIIDFIGQNNKPAAKTLLEETKGLLQKSSSLFTSLADKGAALKHKETFVFSVGEGSENCGDLCELNKKLKECEEKGITLDKAFWVEKEKVEERIAALDLDF
jgi:leucyl aminopeptidase